MWLCFQCLNLLSAPTPCSSETNHEPCQANTTSYGDAESTNTAFIIIVNGNHVDSNEYAKWEIKFQGQSLRFTQLIFMNLMNDFGPWLLV